MVIVFNKGALAVALIALVFLCPVALLWKFQVLEEDSMFLIGSWALFSASFIGTMMQLKGRLFFIFPTWMVTLPCALYTSFHFFEKVISFVKGALFISLLLIILCIVIVFIHEKKQKRNLFFRDITIPVKADGLSKYWRDIRGLFFFPVFGKWTEDIYEYNIRVLQSLKDNQVELRYTDDFLTEMIKMKESLASGHTDNFNKKTKDDFFADIEHQIKIWKDS